MNPQKHIVTTIPAKVLLAMQLIESITVITPERQLQALSCIVNYLNKIADTQVKITENSLAETNPTIISDKIKELVPTINQLKRWNNKFDQLITSYKKQKSTDHHHTFTHLHTGKCVLVNNLGILLYMKMLLIPKMGNTKRREVFSLLNEAYTSLLEYSQWMLLNKTNESVDDLSTLYWSIQHNYCQGLSILLEQKGCVLKNYTLSSEDKQKITESYLQLLYLTEKKDEDYDPSSLAITYLRVKIIPLFKNDQEFFQNLLTIIEQNRGEICSTLFEEVTKLLTTEISGLQTSQSKPISPSQQTEIDSESDLLQTSTPSKKKKKPDRKKHKKKRDSKQPSKQPSKPQQQPRTNRRRLTHVSRSTRNQHKPTSTVSYDISSDTDTDSELEFFEELDFPWMEKKPLKTRKSKTVSTAANPHTFFQTPSRLIDFYLSSAQRQLQIGKEHLQSGNYQEAIRSFHLAIDRDVAEIKDKKLTLAQATTVLGLESDALYSLLYADAKDPNHPDCQNLINRIYAYGIQYSQEGNNRGVITFLEPLNQRFEGAFTNKISELDTTTLEFWFSMQYHLIVAFLNTGDRSQATDQYQKLRSLYRVLENTSSSKTLEKLNLFCKQINSYISVNQLRV